jgi:DNA-damage-inducible protein J
MDESLYRDFSDFCEEVYVPPSALFAAFAAKTVRDQKVPFEITADSFYSQENQQRIAIAIQQLENGQGAVHELIEA